MRGDGATGAITRTGAWCCSWPVLRPGRRIGRSPLAAPAPGAAARRRRRWRARRRPAASAARRNGAKFGHDVDSGCQRQVQQLADAAAGPWLIEAVAKRASSPAPASGAAAGRLRQQHARRRPEAGAQRGGAVPGHRVDRAVAAASGWPCRGQAVALADRGGGAARELSRAGAWRCSWPVRGSSAAWCCSWPTLPSGCGHGRLPRSAPIGVSSQACSFSDVGQQPTSRTPPDDTLRPAT